MRLPQLLSALVSSSAVTCQQLPLQLFPPSDESGYTTDSKAFGDGFDDRVQSLLEHFHVPSMSISVVDGDETFAKGYGHAVLPSEPATPHTLYYTGSTTKSFTAAAFLQLVEASENDTKPLSLKSKLSDLIREEFVLSDPYATALVTVEDALSHRSGLPRHDASYLGGNVSLSDFISKMRYLPFTTELREKWQYNNMMFMAVSYAIERITGTWMSDYLRERIWRPLGMDSTYLGLQEARIAPDLLARGYKWNHDSQTFTEVPYVDVPVISGAGNMISNVLDYSKYLRAMISMDPTILRNTSYAELRGPRAFTQEPWPVELSPWTGPEMYTLAWQMSNYRGYEMFFHGGSIDGFGAQMAYLPGLRNGVGFIGLANTDGSSNMVETTVLFDVLDELIGVPNEERRDWVSFFDGAIAKAKEQAVPDVAKKRLYPSAPPPNKALPLPVPIEDYAATYWNDGYHSITVKCADFVDLPRKPHDGLKATKLLYAEIKYKIWHHTIIFEQISGNFFVAWMENNIHEVLGRQVVVARFELDVAGVVARLGIEYEPAMGREDLVWFERV